MEAPELIQINRSPVSFNVDFNQETSKVKLRYQDHPKFRSHLNREPYLTGHN